ncbi:MAG: putative 3-hydroxybutyryl-CoA dehydrogenase [Smithella sp. PtaU1.Bin162]|nr:MAG: putative 3-hydroxybutyryl-CoA dehydrogenase [Smithella sp. PtaU1.Bin162]
MNITEIKNVAVIGLGIMGPGLAEIFAQAGYRVTVYDKNPSAAARCGKVIETILETMAEFKIISTEEAKAAQANVVFASSPAEAVGNAQIIIEAVSENTAVKKSVFEEIDRFAPPDSLIWSNTSSLNIYEHLPAARIATTIIAHWFAPPHILPLVEVVKGPQTPPATVEATVTVLKNLGKIPIVMEKYVPGFIVNRLQRLLGREIFFLLDGGYVSPEDLDLAVKASIAPRMMVLGLVQRYDFTGLDLSARNLLDENFFDPPVNNKPDALYSKISRGHLGVKTGQGFYDYSGREITEVLKTRDYYLLKVIQNLQFCLEQKRIV